MKTLMKFLAAIFFFAFVSNTSFAQTGNGTNCDGTGIPAKTQDGSGAGLRGGSKGVMNQLREKGGVFQATFRATLTEEQLAIIQNMELTREEKREALQATFSEVQAAMYNSHMAEVTARRALRGSNSLSSGMVKNAIRFGWQKGSN